MALKVVDRVWDITTTTGTGAITLQNAPPNAYQAFSSVMATNDTIYYAIAHQSANQWEVGLATFNSVGPTLTRTTILASSNGGNAVALAAGTKDVIGVWPASKLSALAPVMVALRASAVATVNVSAQTDYFLALDPTANAITVNLPASPATGLSYLIKDATGNAAVHNITITPAAGNIDGSPTFVINTNFQSVAVTYNGTQWSIN